MHDDAPAESIPGLVIKSAGWNQYTTLGVGTASFRLAEPVSTDQLRQLIFYVRDNAPEIHLFPLGRGSNLVGSDIRSDSVLYLKPAGAEFSMLRKGGAENLVESGAANTISAMLDFALDSLHLGGAAALYGIPGSIGGALKMNAGANGKSICDFLETLTVIDLKTGELETIPANRMQWGYRTSEITDSQLVVSAVFRFQNTDPETERKAFEAERNRRGHAPKGRSAGSIFRNPAPALPAGRLLEAAGAKQIGSGSIRVAAEHANWIINTAGKFPTASEQDFIRVLHQMEDAVYQQTGICLIPEVRFTRMETANEAANKNRKLKILVLKGGVSSEREISLESAKNVANALRDAGHDVREFDIKELKLTDDMRWADIVYPVLHGGFGENGELQKMLEDAGIKFVGAGSHACHVVMDKFLSKKVMDENGIRNAAYALMNDANAPIPAALHLPLIVKPVSEGSTFGLTLVEKAEDWKKAIEFALRYDSQVLIEEYISGIEGTVSVVADQALPMVEIRYPGKIYDYDAKYTHAHGETQYLCPPQGIPEHLQQEAADLALRYARAVHAENLVRVDVIVDDKNNKVYVLEGNNMPGCTASSLLPKAANAAGISNPELCSRIAMAAYRKQS